MGWAILISFINWHVIQQRKAKRQRIIKRLHWMDLWVAVSICEIRYILPGCSGLIRKPKFVEEWEQLIAIHVMFVCIHISSSFIFLH